MKKYRLSAQVTISLSTIVEAESEEQAIEIADGRPMCSLPSHEHSGDSEDEVWVHSGEIDGTACHITVEE